MVYFLKMRVTKINVYNGEKLKIGLTNVKNTIKYKRIVGEKTLADLYMWIGEA